MPVVSRSRLRQTLGREYIRDTLVSRTTQATGSGYSVNYVDAGMVDLEASGQGLYYRAWIHSTYGNYRVASYHVGSGAFQVNIGIVHNAIPSGLEYEIHEALSPSEKDLCIDDAIRRIRARQECPLWTIDQARQYVLSENVLDVLDAYYFAEPLGSLTRGQGRLGDFRVIETGSGRELRIDPALGQSQQLVLDAILAPTLGALDTATVSVPDEGWVLWGAAAKCYDLLLRRSPGQEVAAYRGLRAEAAREYTRLAARFQPQIDRPVQLVEAARSGLAESDW